MELRDCLVQTLKGADIAGLPILGKGEFYAIITEQKHINFRFFGDAVLELIEGSISNVTPLGTKWSVNGNKITFADDSGNVYDTGDGRDVGLSLAVGVYKFRYDKDVCVPYLVAYSGSSYLYLNADDIYWSVDALKAITYNTMTYKGGLSSLINKLGSNDTGFYLPFKSDNEGDYTSKVEGKLAEMVELPSSIVRIVCTVPGSITGDLSDLLGFSGFTGLTYINLGSFYYITGSIEVFGTATKLTELGLNNAYSVNGSIDELAQLQVANGRTSGTLVVRHQLTKVIPSSSSTHTIKFGSSMVNPTEQETAQGYQIS